MLPGLLEGQEKMSKSDPNSAIFMEDEEVCGDQPRTYLKYKRSTVTALIPVNEADA